MKNEIWKYIANFNGRYKISNLGNVYSIKNKRLLSRCIKQGYAFASLTKDGITRHFKISRLVALHFIDNEYQKPHVNHKDGNKQNDSVENLEWCTQQENIKHAYNIGLRVGKSFSRKLNDENVIEIRRRYNSGEYNQVKLAKDFGVSFVSVHNIVKHKSWKNI
jgi:hypothetical protein